MLVRKLGIAAFVAVVLLALPRIAAAQSAIAGVVKDASGGVLPGVTVEAASDALIEKTRTAVTDGAGEYKIIDLRPGTYLVTFTLSGFQTYKREGLELPSAFVATVDATMSVGALEESVVVSGSSPVVDVQSNVKAQVLARDVLDSVPNVHTIQSVGQLIPGVTMTAPDVGGSAQMQQTYFSVHGTGATGTSVMIDGMIINALQNDGAIVTYMNDAIAQEMVYGTGGGGGGQQTGGLQINVVPREGGNKFSGSFGFNFENWQNDNFAQSLKNLGVTSVDKLGSYHDVTATEGGPIKANRVWFFLSARLSSEDKPVANATNAAAYGPFPLTDAVLVDANTSFASLAACRSANSANPGACPQGVDPQVNNSAQARLTVQVSAKNKLSLYLDRVHKDRGNAMEAGDDQRITAVHWNSPLYVVDTAKWTTTVSNRLLIQGGWSGDTGRYNNLYQPGLHQARLSQLWYTLATRTNSTDSTRSVTGPAELGQYQDRYNWQASASYVTGTHNVQVGFQDSFGVFNHTVFANGDISETYSTLNGVANSPTSATIQASNPWYAERLNAGLGIYAQDNWTLRRMTITAGLRWDYLNEKVVGMPEQDGIFAVIPAFNDIPMPIQKNWSPHISVVYDLFGNGKTAVRAGWNHFANSATTNLAQGQNPAGNPTSSRPWTDVNTDGVVQYQVTHDDQGRLVSLCTYKTAGCELDFSSLASDYGRAAIANKLDPTLRRPSQDKINIGVSHELVKGVSVTAEWFRTINRDLQTTFNLARLVPCPNGSVDAHALINCNASLDPTTNPNYQAITVYSPVDGHPVTVYDAASTAVSNAATSNFTFTDTNPGRSSVYDGFDFGFNARLPRGGRLFGGSTTERQIDNSCDLAAANPSSLLYCNTASLGGGYSIPWKTQFKLAGTYPLPWWGLVVNGALQALPGYTEGNTTFSVSKTSKYLNCPGNSVALGCVVGAVIAPTQVSTSLSVPLDPSGTTLTPRTNELDLGIAKRLKFGRVRIDPKVDLFNALNSSDYYSVVSTSFSPRLDPNNADPTRSAALPSLANGTNYTAFRQPARFLQGRILRVGANITW